MSNPHVSKAALTAATANTNGTATDVSGVKSQWCSIVNTGSGTCTITLQGGDGAGNWYGLGYQRVDATASPARSVSNISVTANSATAYQILDYYPNVRALLSAQSGTIGVTVTFYGTQI